MANRHFGKAGDVWKHLMLCEVLAALEPTHYAESHAGSGAYDLVHDDERNYGVGHFLEVSSVVETLGASAYAQVLHRFTSTGRARYPGSALQAMTLLGDTCEYLFCDVDPVSADDLRLWGRNLELSRCQVVERDGMTVVAEWLETCASSRCVVHIDPFDPFTAQPGGLSAVQLAGQVAESGKVLVYWYGFDTPVEQAWALAEIAQHTSEPLTCLDVVVMGETGEGMNGDLGVGTTPGTGFGVVLANVGEQVIASCDRLGGDLIRTYEGKRLPDGQQGQLRVTRRQQV
jgi:23S rRNA A2030 N6-methylase RlmJ